MYKIDIIYYKYGMCYNMRDARAQVHAVITPACDYIKQGNRRKVKREL